VGPRPPTTSNGRQRQAVAPLLQIGCRAASGLRLGCWAATACDGAATRPRQSSNWRQGGGGRGGCGVKPAAFAAVVLRGCGIAVWRRPLVLVVHARPPPSLNGRHTRGTTLSRSTGQAVGKGWRPRTMPGRGGAVRVPPRSHLTVRTAGHVGRDAVLGACALASNLYPGGLKQCHWRYSNFFAVTNQSSVSIFFGLLFTVQHTCVIATTKRARQYENCSSGSGIHHSPGTRHSSCADHKNAIQTSHRSLPTWGSHAHPLEVRGHTLTTPECISQSHLTRQHDGLEQDYHCAPWQHGAPPCGTQNPLSSRLSYSHYPVISVPAISTVDITGTTEAPQSPRDRGM